jgi:hypothetical protein
MFAVVLFVCAVTVAPVSCTRETALDVLAGPAATNEITCGLYAQAFYAETAMGRDMRDDEYLMWRCTRTVIAEGSVG